MADKRCRSGYRLNKHLISSDIRKKGARQITQKSKENTHRLSGAVYDSEELNSTGLIPLISIHMSTAHYIPGHNDTSTISADENAKVVFTLIKVAYL